MVTIVPVTEAPDPGCGFVFCEVVGGVGDVAGGVAGAISYWSDPWGNTFKALQDAASSMSNDILPALTEAATPDYSAEWFLNAYKVSFAAAIFVAVALLIPQFVRTARGKQSGRTLVDSLGVYFGVFLAGGMFGPMFGIMLVNFFHSLSSVFIAFGVSGSVDDTVAKFQSMIEDTDPVGITGGIVVANILMLLMIVGLFFVLLILLVRLVTLYFAGTMFPLGLVWIIDPTKRQFGLKIAWLILGLLAAEPLLWLLLGVAFSMLANSVGTFGNNLSLQSFVTLIVALIAVFGAALSPLLLLRFAPVLPMGAGGTDGPGLSNNPIGSDSVSDATNRHGLQSSPEASQPTVVEPAAPVPAEAGAGIGAEAASAGVGATAGAGAGAAETVAAAGAAETATGVGAVIGVPTMLAAGGLAVASKGFDALQEANEYAALAMEDEQVAPEREE